jgi:CRISPR-associated protein Cas6
MTNLDNAELRFSVIGNRLNIDHGYQLYSALKLKLLQKNPEILINRNLPRDVNISRVTGKYSNYYLFITNTSKLKIRGPRDYLRELKKTLDEQVILVGDTKLFLYEGKVLTLLPAHSLKSEMVVIKSSFWDNIDYPKKFLTSCKKQLLALNIFQEPILVEQLYSPEQQKIMVITKDSCTTKYIGYSVAVNNLNKQESIALKIKGIGGKRHMGCGWFE